VRVPPYAAVQCIEGPRHTRGTPPNVVEMDAATWIGLATGRLRWEEAIETGAVRASGARADLRGHLPVGRSDKEGRIRQRPSKGAVAAAHRLSTVPVGDGRLSHDLDPSDRAPRDACGVFGVWVPPDEASTAEVSKLAYYGLYALQHRGQESAGIAVSD